MPVPMQGLLHALQQAAPRAASLLLALAVWTAPARAEVVEAVLAVVDREPILRSDLLLNIAPELNMIESQGGAGSQERIDELMRQALDSAINSKILLREAQLNAAQFPVLEVTTEDVEEELERTRALYENPEDFQREIEAVGDTMADIRERLRKQIMASRMGYVKRREFAEQAVVSESEVAQYYQDHREEYDRPERVRVRQIFLQAPEDEPAERARAVARMDQLLAELDAGADFAELAAAHSEAVGAEEGGLIGWNTRGNLVDVLDEAAFSLEPGQYSGVLETPFGVHILYVDDREAAGTADLDEVRTEIAEQIRDEKAAEAYNQWLRELRKRSRVQVFL